MWMHPGFWRGLIATGLLLSAQSALGQSPTDLPDSFTDEESASGYDATALGLDPLTLGQTGSGYEGFEQGGFDLGAFDPETAFAGLPSTEDGGSTGDPGSGSGGVLAQLLEGLGSEPDNHWIDEAALPFEALDGIPTTRLWGVSGKTSYRIEVPSNWNGELVVSAWGFTGFCLEPDAPACRLYPRIPSIRSHLIEQGFAWASSSYSTSGWSVSQGAFDNQRLRAEFARLVGQPERVYGIGTSMGGKIVGLENEQFDAYDGTLALCADVGRDEVASLWVEWNLLATTLAGLEEQVAVPAPADYMGQVVPPTRSALGVPFPTLPTALGENLLQAAMRRSGGSRPRFDKGFALADHLVFGLNETLFSVFGGEGDFAVLLNGDATGQISPWPVDGNEGVVYQLDDDPGLSPAEVDLNARIPRIAKRPRTDSFAFPHLEGELSAPMMVLHPLGDLLVPLSIPQAYVKNVQAQDAEDLLVTRATRGVTHCGFTPWEIERAFDDLVTWVETDTQPDGDDFLDASSVAAPDFGCAWSGEAAGQQRAADVDICANAPR